MSEQQKSCHIVIIGGGAGGLELATRLGRKYKSHSDVKITLVDQNLTHIWKPLWHELAAGTLNATESEINYLIHGSRNNYAFELGRWEGLDRAAKQITLAPVYDERQGLIIPRRQLDYDILVIAVGSVSNNFGIAGVAEYCETLDSQRQAYQFHQKLLHHCMRIQYNPGEKHQLSIAIVGGGATGVELAAELYGTFRQIAYFGWNRLKLAKIQLNIIESSPRLLPALPERISTAVQQRLRKYGIAVYTQARVNHISAKGIHTEEGLFIPADLCVWAAGIKAPDFLGQIAGLETNHLNQIRVQSSLQSLSDTNIFAMGDCACCPQENSKTPVPPRAQAAHQQAKFLARALERYQSGQTLGYYQYRDRGSLITLSRSGTIGYLSGGERQNIYIEGWLARFFYWLLYKNYQYTLFGAWRVFLLTLSQWLNPKARPRLKLH